MFFRVKVVFAACFCFVVEEAAVRTGKFQSCHVGRRMTRGIVQQIAGTTVAECAISCFGNDSLSAFNYDSATGTCDLITATDSAQMEHFVNDSSYNYYSLQSSDPCQPSPCSHGALCQLSPYDQTDYDCLNCPYPFGGKKCDELKCDTTCFRNKDMVYFIYYDTHGSWDTAYNRCLAKDLQMTVIKDSETQSFIADQLSGIYANYTDVNQALWIGLRRDDSRMNFSWVDGSAMGNWSGWYSEKPLDDSCVCVPNGVFNFQWDDDPCEGVKGWDYVPFCQKRYSFITAN